MFLALASCSSLGLWMLCNESKILGSMEWSQEETRNLSGELSTQLKALLFEHSTPLESIKAIFCVSGPGAYTGLRCGASFCQGLSAGLNIPMISIPTYRMYGSPIWIPLRHSLARKLSFTEALTQNMGFLEISKEEEFLSSPPLSEQQTLGLLNKPLWPQPDELFRGLQNSLPELHATPQTPFKILYGSAPNLRKAHSPI